MAYLKGYMVPPGQGGNVTISEADYMTLKASSSQAQHTGVYDPDKYYYIYNLNEEGWVETDWLTATANSDTTLTFSSSTIDAADAASIHADSLIQICAEAINQTGVYTVSPIYARVSSQSEGSCTIVFDKQPLNTKFQLWIRNM